MSTTDEYKPIINRCLKGTGIIIKVHKSGDDIFLTLLTGAKSTFCSEAQLQAAFDARLPTIKAALSKFEIIANICPGNLYKSSRCR